MLVFQPVATLARAPTRSALHSIYTLEGCVGSMIITLDMLQQLSRDFLVGMRLCCRACQSAYKLRSNVVAVGLSFTTTATMLANCDHE